MRKITTKHHHRLHHVRKYRKDFYFVDWFHGSALHGNRGAACREAHTDLANESGCLTVDNVWNEVVTIH
jgi:hypothetical protein